MRRLWDWKPVEQSRQDIAYAVRTFARAPAFSTLVVLTLALGIGATSAVFSIVNAILLNPLPYPHAHRLVAIWEKLTRDPKNPPIFDSYSDFESWKKHSNSFEMLAPATWATGQQIVRGAGPAREVLAMPVGIEFFKLLGAKPALGRLFQPDDLKRDCIVVLKHQFWAEAFGSDKRIPGKQIQLGQRACTVAGVTSPGFTFYPEAASMWMLITGESEIARNPGDARVGVFGLLKPGVSIERAQKELDALFTNEHRNDKDGIWRLPAVFPLGEQFAYLTGPNLRLSVMVLFAGVSCVLLVACVNVANLLLGRSLVRQKELAARAALGSGRARLIRQLLTESFLLSFAGAGGGILLAICAVRSFRALDPIPLPPGNPVAVNWYVLAFTVVLAVATALIFGLLPAVKASRVDVIEALKASGRSTLGGPNTRRLGKALVSVEVALSLALLTGASLLIESVSRLASQPVGFRTARVLTVPIELPDWMFSKADQRVGYYDAAIERVAGLPGVVSAAFASSLPLENGRWRASVITVEGQPEASATAAVRDAAQCSITSNYFQVMGVPLLSGRLFDSRDRAGTQPVAVVNQALARKYFPNVSPIGKQIKIGDPGTERPWLTVVGVVADEKDRDFFHEMAWEDIPLVFRPVAQDAPLTGSLVLRAFTAGKTLVAEVRKEVADLDPSVPVGEGEWMNDRLSKLFAYPRFRAALLGAFAGLALLLAAVGLFGVLSQLTTQRMQEFGVRMAVGAQKRDLFALVLREGLALTAIGIGTGIVLAWWLTRLLEGLLYEVKATDPLIMGGVSLLLLFVSIVATWLPARTAARVDAMTALRYE
jgi:putative ABC transport system permease protein